MSNYFYHHGIKGQKWGVRRYQNEDGTLTTAGKNRYLKETAGKIGDALKPHPMDEGGFTSKGKIPYGAKSEKIPKRKMPMGTKSLERIYKRGLSFTADVLSNSVSLMDPLVSVRAKVGTSIIEKTKEELKKKGLDDANVSILI